MMKQINIISNNNELHKAFAHSLKAVGGMEVAAFTNCPITDKNQVILIAMPGQDIREIIYEQVRGAKYLNPIRVIGFKKRELFLKEFPLFSDHPYNHDYLRIPFDLLHFINSL